MNEWQRLKRKYEGDDSSSVRLECLRGQNRYFLTEFERNCEMGKSATISDADILEHVTTSVNGELDPATAHAILELRFDKDATNRIRKLLQKNNRGTISAEERITLERFLRFGKVIDLMHAKARLSLKEAGLPH